MENRCSGPECSRESVANGYCNGHYVQTRRGMKLAPLRKVRKRSEIMLRDSEGNKQCNKCFLWMSEDHYTAHKNTLDKLQATCRSCAAREHKLRYYGVDTEQLLVEQNYRCAICGIQKDDTNKVVWHIDHDHRCCSGVKTCGNCIRGVLCQQCNQGLGNFKDNTELLEQAAKYLIQANAVE